MLIVMNYKKNYTSKEQEEKSIKNIDNKKYLL